MLGPLVATALLRLDRHRRLVAALCAAAAVLLVVQSVTSSRHGVRVLAAARDVRAGSALSAADVRAVVLPADTVPDGALRPGAVVVGRVVVGAVRRGEPLTDVRLASPRLLAGHGLPPGAVAVTVPVVDDSAWLVRAGDRVDVLAAWHDDAPGGAGAAGPDETGGAGAAGPDETGGAGAAGPDETGGAGATGPDQTDGRPAAEPDPESGRSGSLSAPSPADVVAGNVLVLAVADSLANSGTRSVVVACAPHTARLLAAAAARARLSLVLRRSP